MLPPAAAKLRPTFAIAGIAQAYLRLHSRIAEETTRQPVAAWGSGDIHLHSTARQRLHANPKRKGVA